MVLADIMASASSRTNIDPGPCIHVILQAISTCSGTSDSGPSEIGTLYNKPLYKLKDTVRGPKNYMPYSFSTFRTSKRGQPLYKGQNS